MPRIAVLLTLFLALALPLRAGAGPVYLGTGDRLQVLLQENGGTGFEWALASPARGKVARLVDTTLQRTTMGVPGAPQFRVFELEGCAADGTQTLKFEMRAPWEKGEPAERFEVTLQGTRQTSVTKVTPLVYLVRPQTRFAVSLPLTAEGWSWKWSETGDAAVLKPLGRERQQIRLQAAAQGQTSFLVTEEPTQGPATEPRRSLFVTVTVAK